MATGDHGKGYERFPSADIMVKKMWSIFCVVLDVWDPWNHKVPKIKTCMTHPKRQDFRNWHRTSMVMPFSSFLSELSKGMNTQADPNFQTRPHQTLQNDNKTRSYNYIAMNSTDSSHPLNDLVLVTRGIFWAAHATRVSRSDRPTAAGCAAMTLWEVCGIDCQAMAKTLRCWGCWMHGHCEQHTIFFNHLYSTMLLYAHGPWHGPSRECCFNSEDRFSKELEVRGGEARWNVEQYREHSFKELHWTCFVELSSVKWYAKLLNQSQLEAYCHLMVEIWPQKSSSFSRTCWC